MEATLQIITTHSKKKGGKTIGEIILLGFGKTKSNGLLPN